MGEVTYVNGRLVPSEEAAVSARDAGFLYGDGLFETMRVYSGRIFALQPHMERLRAGAEKIGINNLPSPDNLKSAIEKTVYANDVSDVAVRITVTRGAPDAKSPTIVIQIRPVEYTASNYELGVACLKLPDTRGSISHLKSLNFLPNLMAKREATRKGFFEALLIGGDGMITEGSISNVFVVSQGDLRTPALSDEILSGVTRGIVMDIAKEMRIVTRAESICAEDIPRMEEIFLTGTIMEIMPVVSVDGKPIGSGRPGRITKELLKSYRRLVTASREAG